MHRFFIEAKDLLEDSRAVLTNPSDVKHLSRVLRAVEGEAVELCVDHKQEWVGMIEQINEDSVYFYQLKERSTHRESPIEVHLFQGLPKADKMEWIVQKTVELGVNAITSVQMTRCVAKLSDEKDNKKKTERWQKIADEAAKQSKRLAKVRVEEAIKLKALLDCVKAYDLFLVPYELEQSCGLKPLLASWEASRQPRKIAILIGPEGGIDTAEIEALVAAGATPITLGPRIMRTETAGIAALTMLQYALGDLGGSVSQL